MSSVLKKADKLNLSLSLYNNIRHTLQGNEIVAHSDAVGASWPVGAAPTTSSFST